MPKKTFSNPVVNELKGSAWFKRPKETIILDKNKTNPNSKHKKTVAQKRVSPTNSTVDNQPKPPSVQSVHKTEKVKRTQRSNVHSGQLNEKVERTKRSSVQHPKKEQTKRRAYDFYVRQLTSLRKIRATRELSEDKSISMSAIVREAIDLFLEEQGVK